MATGLRSGGNSRRQPRQAKRNNVKSLVSGRIRLFAWLCALLTLAACGGASAERRSGSGEGDLAPDFTLESLDGRQVSLSDFRGSVVLINLWATWCPACKTEVATLDASYRAHRDEGYVVLGIAIGESKEAVVPFVARMSMTYPVLLDAEGTMMERYRALGLPTSVLVDREGIVRLRHQGELSSADLSDYLSGLLPSH